MKERRLLKAITASLILGLWVLISIPLPAQAQPIPVTSNLSVVSPHPFGISTLNSSTYFDFLSSYINEERTFTTPFETSAALNTAYSNMMSHGGAQAFAYSNLLGMNFQEGREFYFDPVTAASGQYRKFISPYGGFSSDTAFVSSPGSITTHVSRELSMPWFYYGTVMDMAQGAGVAPSVMGGVPVVSSEANVSHASFGLPMATDVPGMSNYLRGVLALKTYGSAATAMNQAWDWDYAYTKEGMAFVPNFAYYNIANETGWYFGADVSNVQTGTEAGPGILAGYTFINEAPESLAASTGLLGLIGLGPGVLLGGAGALEGGDVLLGGGPFFMGSPLLMGAPLLGGAGALEGGDFLLGGGPFFMGGPLLMGAPLLFGAGPLFGFGIAPSAGFGIGGGGAIEAGFISGRGITYGGIPGLMW